MQASIRMRSIARYFIMKKSFLFRSSRCGKTVNGIFYTYFIQYSISNDVMFSFFFFLPDFPLPFFICKIFFLDYFFLFRNIYIYIFISCVLIIYIYMWYIYISSYYSHIWKYLFNHCLLLGLKYMF